MTRFIKRMTALTLSFLIITILSDNISSSFIKVYAEEASQGQCGENVYYSLENGILEIFGKGEMYNYTQLNLSGTRSNSPFSCVENISEIIIDDGVTTIGEYSFLYCEGLKRVSLPDSIQAIGKWSFAHCTQLLEFTIPKNVSSIGFGFLYKCCSVQNLSVDNNNLYFYSENNVLFNKEKTELIFCTYGVKKYAIPDTVNTITYGAFAACEELTEVIIPESVNVIDNYAFSKCYKLNNVIVPQGVSSIGACTFRYCLSLTDITIPSTVQYIHEEAFNLCKDVTIHGCKGSTAEAFAEQAGFTFIADDSRMPTGNTVNNFLVKGVMLNCNSLDMYVNDTNDLRVDSVDYFFSKSPGEIKVKSSNSDIVTIEDINSLDDVSGSYYQIKIRAVGIGEAEISVYTAFDVKNCTVTVSGDQVDTLHNYVKVDWYNGVKLLKSESIQKGTIPQYSEEAPVDPYGLNRKFLGWTKNDNRAFVFNTPDDLTKLFQDTTYYAVYDNNLSDSNLEIIDYINQHYVKAKSGDWKSFQETSNIKNQLENSPSEVGHYGYAYMQYVEKLASLNLLGVIDQYKANEYTAILLDMFLSVEGIDKPQTILNSAALKSEEEVISTLKKILSINKIGDFDSDQKSYELAKELYNAVSIGAFNTESNKKQGIENDVQKIISKNIVDVCKKHNVNPSQLGTKVNIELFNSSVSDTLKSVGIGITTVKDYIDNVNAIVEAETLYNMGCEYRALLNRIYDESEKFQGNSWEIQDLKNALKYQIEYHDKYSQKIHIEAFKASYEATNGFVELSGTSLIEMITEKSSQEMIAKFLSDTLTPKMIKKINEAAKTNNIQSGSSSVSVSEAMIAKYMSAASLGITVGNVLSDALFDSKNINDLYYKGKCYAILEEILLNVIDEKAQALSRSIESGMEVQKQYNAAVEFDKAYKMYMYVESNGLKTYGEYEECFALKKITEDDGIFEKLKKGFNNFGTEVVLAMQYLSKGDQETIALYSKHILNAISFKEDSDYILKNCQCHKGYNFGSSNTYDVFKLYRGFKLALICCPVKVNVYDESHKLIGTLSQNYSNVSEEYSNYLYRIESIDANFVMVPESYTIEIVGLDNGTMNIISAYCYDSEMKNAMICNNMLVNNEFTARLEINEESASITNDVIVGENKVIIAVLTLLTFIFVIIGLLPVQRSK